MRNWKQLLGALEPAEREPLEVRSSVIEAIEALAQPLGDGRRGLLHNRITVRLLCENTERRDLIHAVLTAEPGLRDALEARLAAAGCRVPADLEIEVVKDAPPVKGLDFDLKPSIAGPAAPAAPKAAPGPAAAALPPTRIARPKARLVLIAGTGPIHTFEIASDVVNIGRVQEVRGKDHRPLRRNHLYFSDGETTVSRQHARIRWDGEAGVFRLFDERSARGTRLFSNGEPIDVAPGRGRGELLHSGDEIYFGNVGVRFEILD